MSRLSEYDARDMDRMQADDRPTSERRQRLERAVLETAIDKNGQVRP